MQLQQPGAPRVGQVREHRHRPDQVELLVAERKRRPLVALEHVERRAEVRLAPVDALRVDVAPVDLGDLRLLQEVPQHPAGAAPEVEHPAALPAPVGGQHREDLLPQRAARLPGSWRPGPAGSGRRRTRRDAEAEAGGSGNVVFSCSVFPVSVEAIAADHPSARAALLSSAMHACGGHGLALWSAGGTNPAQHGRRSGRRSRAPAARSKRPRDLSGRERQAHAGDLGERPSDGRDGQPGRLGTDQAHERAEETYFPAWSADGRRIAFAANAARPLTSSRWTPTAATARRSQRAAHGPDRTRRRPGS